MKHWPIILATVYLTIAVATFGYEAHRPGDADYKAGNAGSGALAGIFWPLYLPARASFNAWQPYWSQP